MHVGDVITGGGTSDSQNSRTGRVTRVRELLMGAQLKWAGVVVISHLPSCGKDGWMTFV